MDAAARSNGRAEDSERQGQGILGALPRTRPQRASPRRAATQSKRPRTGAPAKAEGPLETGSSAKAKAPSKTGSSAKAGAAAKPVASAKRSSSAKPGSSSGRSASAKPGFSSGRSSSAKPGSSSGRSSAAKPGSSPKRSSSATPRSAKPAAGAKAASAGRPTNEQTAARRNQPPAPRQGYEPEEELELGASVHPPSGVELVESVAEIFLELASAGLKAGGQTLKDVLSPLRRAGK